MKDTFKKFGKDAINVAKTEMANGVDTVKKEVNTGSESIKGGTTSGIGSNLTKMAIGAADILEFGGIEQSNSLLSKFILKDEKVYFYLACVNEEIAVTNFGLVYSHKASITSSKTTFKRVEFKGNEISNLRIETAGKIDRDAELVFELGGEKLSWNINKGQLENIFELYNCLAKVKKIQNTHQSRQVIVRESLDVAAASVGMSTTENPLATFEQIYQLATNELTNVSKIDYTEAFE